MIFYLFLRYYEKAEEQSKTTETKVKRKKLESNLTNNVQITIPNLIQRGAGISFWPDDHEILQRIDKAIMDFFIIDMLPYSIVQSNAFRKLNFADLAKPSKYRMKSEKYSAQL